MLTADVSVLAAAVAVATAQVPMAGECVAFPKWPAASVVTLAGALTPVRRLGLDLDPLGLVRTPARVLNAVEREVIEAKRPEKNVR